MWRSGDSARGLRRPVTVVCGACACVRVCWARGEQAGQPQGATGRFTFDGRAFLAAFSAALASTAFLAAIAAALAASVASLCFTFGAVS